jgi:hypothetical protein
MVLSSRQRRQLLVRLPVLLAIVVPIYLIAFVIGYRVADFITVLLRN